MYRFLFCSFFLPIFVFAQRSSPLAQATLTKVYTQAIGDYVKAANKKHKSSFDTLFLGKHVFGQPDDFPDIKLPKTIENTEIRLIKPEIGAKMQKERKSMVYINLMGWVEKETAEFIFVTFSNGGEHQFDCHLNYKFNSKSKRFELEKTHFENFQRKN